MAYITMQKIEKVFGNNQVIKGINLTVEKGQFVTLLGPSGCGKSTLLRCLAGLEELTGGSILLDGEDITYKEPKERNVGMIFQQYSLFPNMNVLENIAFGLKLKKMDRHELEAKVETMIRMVELDGKEKQYPAQLSGGQQQRVALARALVMEPKVLLLDEPFSAIDAKLRRALQTRLLEIQKELGITALFVTHDQDEAMILSDVIHLMNNGTIEQSGDPFRMYTAPKTSFAAGFIGHYNVVSRLYFQKIVKDFPPGIKDIAIRPETIELSRNPMDQNENQYRFLAKVKDHTLRGNVLRYTIDVNGIDLKVDVLFRSFTLFEDGSHVHAAIEKRNCLEIDV